MLWILIADSVIIGVISWLIAKDLVPVRLTVLIVYPILILANFIVIRRVRSRRNVVVEQSRRRLPVLVLGATAFSVATMVQFAYWIIKPEVLGTVELVLGILLSTYAWFLVNRVGKLKSDAGGDNLTKPPKRE